MEKHLETAQRFCLVLAIWGDRYPDAVVNALVEEARQGSPGLEQVILLTDRHRPRVDAFVQQKMFPVSFQRKEFFSGGYRVKLAVFSREVLPPSMPCVYLDLDSMVTGDLGRLAALVKSADDVFMLPPGGLLGFHPLRRWLHRRTRGKRYATGNSSIMVYRSDAARNIAQRFLDLLAEGASGRHMAIDDVFISWAAQEELHAVPAELGVSFRREFLAKFGLFLGAKSRSPATKRRRASIVAVTFNGLKSKPESLAQMRPAARIEDGKGRVGFWTEECLGVFKARIEAHCRRVARLDGTGATPGPDGVA